VHAARDRAHHHLRLQAKGRIERLWGTLQSRLISELRLRGVTTIDAANSYLPEFMADYNRRFAVKPDLEASLFAHPHPQRKSTSIFPPNSRGSRTTAPHLGLWAEGSNSSTTMGQSQGSLRRPSSTYMSQGWASASPSSMAGYGTWWKSREGKWSRSRRKAGRPPFVPGPNHPWRKFVINPKRGRNKFRHNDRRGHGRRTPRPRRGSPCSTRPNTRASISDTSWRS
jgi:hypothetical protein